MNKTKEAYKVYYRGLKTAIGGNERFLWVNNILLKDITGKTILDIGCGEGSLLKILQEKNNKVFGLDVSETAQLACKDKGLDCRILDISREKFPYTDSMFDIVLCLETIEHLENPYHCIWQIKRILKEEGTLIISIPNFKILHPYIYPSLFEFKNFKTFLKLNSFEITGIKGWGQIAMLNKLSRWLKSKKNAFTLSLAAFIFYLSRKRNSLMRNHIGTPLTYSYTWNFICLNHKRDKTLLEEIAEETTPTELIKE